MGPPSVSGQKTLFTCEGDKTRVNERLTGEMTLVAHFSLSPHNGTRLPINFMPKGVVARQMWEIWLFLPLTVTNILLVV